MYVCKDYGKPVYNCLENPLVPSHIFDLRAFAPLYLNYQRKIIW